MLDLLYKSLLHKFSLYLGHENRQVLTDFMERSTAMTGHVGLLRPDALKELVENLSETDAQAYFQLSKIELIAQVPYLLGQGEPVVLSERAGCCTGIGSFWSPIRRADRFSAASRSSIVQSQGGSEDGERERSSRTCAIL